MVLRDHAADRSFLRVGFCKGCGGGGVSEVILKPCPFCGGKPVKQKEGLSEVYGYADRVSYTCKDCGCTRGAQGISGNGYADNSTVEARALERWNTRVALVELPKLWISNESGASEQAAVQVLNACREALTKAGVTVK